MTLPADQLAIVQQWCGTAVGVAGAAVYTDGDVAARIGRLGSPQLAALQILRTQLADLLADPASIDAQGDWSQDTKANIDAYEKRIVQLEEATGQGTVTVTGLTTYTPLPRFYKTRGR